jgi:hypothetical protein
VSRPARIALRAAALVGPCATVLGCAVATTANRTTTARTVGHSADAGCQPEYGFATLAQANDGKVFGCLRVGPLPGGPHRVVIEQFAGYASPLKLPKRALGRYRWILYPKEPAVRLTLSPASGPPGTRVTVTGHVLASGGLGPAAHLPRIPRFCWDGCRYGLPLDSSRVVWISSSTFHAVLRVPAAPWVEGGPVRVVPLASGNFPVGVECVVFGKFCFAEGSEGTAEFAMQVERGTARCQTPPSCARLHVSPASALPGDAVKVSGFAPLASGYGAVQAEVLPGRVRGPQVRFSVSRNRGATVTLGQAPLSVRRSPSFASVSAAPIAEITAGLSAVSAQPGNPSTVAWCGRGEIGVSRAGIVASIPTGGAAAALVGLHLQPAPQTPPSCVAVAPAGPASDPLATVLAAFSVAPVQGAPPFYDVALTTRDGGRTWLPLPVPPGTAATGFGGFRYVSGGVEAVFAADAPGNGTKQYPAFDPNRPLTEISTDGGRTWTAAPLSCPAAGPCVTLGPYLPGNCAMGLGLQALLRSSDAGHSWTPPAVPDQIYPCGEAELFPTGTRAVLLVNSLSPYTVVRSTDGGVSWSYVALPRIPGAPAGQGVGFGPSGITVLPDGSLLLTGGFGYLGGWLLLAHDARAWCAVHSPGAPIQRAPLMTPITVIGSELWWLTGGSGSALVAHELPASALAC